MIIEAQCVNLALSLDGFRRQLLLVQPSDTVKELTPVLQRAINRDDDPFFQVIDAWQEGRKLGIGQRVDTLGFLGGTLKWNFNRPVKVSAVIYKTDGKTQQRDLWLRQMEQNGDTQVQVDPNDKKGIQWLNDNNFTAASYVVYYRGKAVTADKLQSLADAPGQNLVKVDIRASNSIQLLVHRFDGSVVAVKVQHDDTVDTLKQRYNCACSKTATGSGSCLVTQC
jgi:phosphatidylserine/phosphatidylglycerophosphate/cardiolipin synthase-like enzyme